MVCGGVMGFEEEVSDSFAGYVGGYATYRVNERLWLTGGFFYSRHQEIAPDFGFVPIIGVLLNLGATHGFSARLGLPETRATWHFNERTRLVLDLKTIEGGVTRLADRDPNPLRIRWASAVFGAVWILGIIVAMDALSGLYDSSSLFSGCNNPRGVESVEPRFTGRSDPGDVVDGH